MIGFYDAGEVKSRPVLDTMNPHIQLDFAKVSKS